MNWNDRLLADESEALDTGKSLLLPMQIESLIDRQRQEWAGLQQGIAALSEAETRIVQLSSGRVVLQHNPQRIVSTSARVDTQTIGTRPCFLCPENMPAEERGINFLDRYAIVCNPFPVLPSHLVIAAREHRPQRIVEHFADMSALASALGPEYAVFYNGPACGASAPDHLHFQAARKERLPIIQEMNTELQGWVTVPVNERRLIWKTMPNYRVNLYVAESDNVSLLGSWFVRLMELLERFHPDSKPEPMVNLMVEKMTVGGLRLVVFPRERHRPSAYFIEGGGKLTISPAAIDLAGVMVAPVEADFRRLTASMIEEIFREVTLAPNSYNRLWHELTSIGRGF